MMYCTKKIKNPKPFFLGGGGGGGGGTQGLYSLGVSPIPHLFKTKVLLCLTDLPVPGPSC